MILQSASKIVFITMTFGIIGLTFIGKLDPKDFLVLASMTFSYYYTRNKTDTN